MPCKNLFCVLACLLLVLSMSSASAGTVHTVQSAERHYECKNHLENVVQVVSDKKLVAGGNSSTQTTQPSIEAQQDYYAYGSALPGRSSQPAHRYGFNGMEQDAELKGRGNSYHFGARLLDPRLGRWLSIDPLAQQYTEYSPYCFVGNMPIAAMDPDGEKIKIVSKDAAVRKQIFNDLQKFSRAKLVLLDNGQVVKASKARRQGLAVEFTGVVS